MKVGNRKERKRGSNGEVQAKKELWKCGEKNDRRGRKE